MHSTIVVTTLTFFCLFIAILGESLPEGAGYSPHNTEFSDSGSDQDENERSTPGPRSPDPEVADQLEGNVWLDVIPGTPGKDYPNYDKIPETSFKCDGKTVGGYYADIEARCQVFHVCNTGGVKSTFVCPSGSIFNQKYFVCDWWYDFECDDATDLYSLNDEVNRGGDGSGPGGPGWIEENFENLENHGDQVFENGRKNPDLSLAGTGEGGPGYSRTGSRGYQSNANDGVDQEKQNGGNRVKNFNLKNAESFHSNKHKKGVDEDVRIRKQNSTPDINSGVNYPSMMETKNDNFRHRNDQGRRERGNGFNENPYIRENRNRAGVLGNKSSPPGGRDYVYNSDFDNGQSSDTRDRSVDHTDNDVGVNPDGTPSRSNDNVYGIPVAIRGGIQPKLVLGRQRNSGGLPGGLGNGYPSPGRSRVLPGSDGIANGAITPGESRTTPVYDEGDQRFAVVNFGTPERRIFRDIGTDDTAKSTGNLQTEKRDDSKTGIDSHDIQFRNNRKYSDHDFSDYRYSNRYRNDDYLVGIVPGEESQTDDRSNFGQFNKPRRYLPIL